MTTASRRLLAVTLTALVLAGCSGGSADETTPSVSPQSTQQSAQQSATSSAPTTKAVPQDEGGPLTALPDCAEPPQAVPADVPGLVLPDGAVVTSVKEDGPLVTVEAYVEQTPIEIRRSYQERPGLEMFSVEDEIFEAEVLYGQGEFRSYAKASGTCKTGSTLTVVVGPAGDTN